MQWIWYLYSDPDTDDVCILNIYIIGHNLGLYHSQEEHVQKDDPTQSNIAAYGDTTGMMGSATRNDDTNMCFNPAVSDVKWCDVMWLQLQTTNDTIYVYNCTLRCILCGGWYRLRLVFVFVLTILLLRAVHHCLYFVGYSIVQCSIPVVSLLCSFVRLYVCWQTSSHIVHPTPCRWPVQ